MINSQQRKQLKVIGHKLNPVFSIGKELLNDNLIKSINEYLEKNEILKMQFLKSAHDQQDVLEKEILKLTNSEFVQSIGFKFIIYRKSQKPKIFFD